VRVREDKAQAAHIASARLTHLSHPSHPSHLSHPFARDSASARARSTGLLSYLRLTGKPLGLLINFNVPVRVKGVTRKMNGSQATALPAKQA
jgi:hypothetical protein